MKFSSLTVSALWTLLLLLGRFQASAALFPGVPALELKVVGTYETGIFDEGAAEIVAHDPCTQRLFVVNGFDRTIDVIDVQDAETPWLLGKINIPADFSPNSVVFLPKQDAIAVAAGNEANPALNGKIFFFEVDVKGLSLSSLVPTSAVEVGNRPDSLTLTKDGKYILVANEGELLEGLVDPAGSVSIIFVKDGVGPSKLKVATLGFANLDTAALKAKGVRIRPGASATTDLEPEYIAVDPNSAFAFVSLQENNAVLKINIANFAKLLNGQAFVFQNEDVFPLGSQDHGTVCLDPSDRDGAVSFRVAANVLGLRMPDGIVSFEDKDGQLYFATANEGDSRDTDAYSDEARLSSRTLLAGAFPNGNDLKTQTSFGRLTVSTVDGQTSPGSNIYSQVFAFGSRSFSIFDANGNLVFDSGSDFEVLTFAANPAFFNSDHAEANFDSRSDNKGPEPESLTVGEIDGRIYAFILLERVGGIMVYDVTEPAETFFVTYVNNRDFTVDQRTSAAGDLGPEGIIFIDKDDSPTGNYMLAVANEVSGTTTLYDIIKGACPAEGKGSRERGLLEWASSAGVNRKQMSKRGQSSTQAVRKLNPKCGKKRA